MKIFKNAIVFSAELPSGELVLHHIAELPFEPIGPTFVSRSGFIPNPVTKELVTPIEGGFSVTIQLDEKILPKAAVSNAIESALAARATELARELEDDEIEFTTAQTMTTLIANALVKTTTVNAFYCEEEKLLIIPTTSKPLSQAVMRLLIQAIGSVKTSTIHVDNIKGGLTTRLKNYLNGDSEAFGDFELGETCNLKQKADKANFSLHDLDGARQGLLEGLVAGMQVELMELVHEGVSFKLTNDFKLRGIDFHGELTEDEQAALDDAEGDGAYLWRLEAATQLLQVVATIKALCEMFEYKVPAPVEFQSPADLPSHESVPELDDPLYEEAVAFVRDSRRASISAIQRKLKLGYNRSARLIERMEQDGVVTAMHTNGSREVIG